jgi:hypothetical protein
MILEDLEYIFKPQIDKGTTILYFMLHDGADSKEICRHSASDLAGLVPVLDNFQYVGTAGGIPRFKK